MTEPVETLIPPPASMQRENTTLLRMRGISKRYGGVQALSAVDLDLRAGEVHALLGENGAGKSTLIKVLAGATQPDEGTVEIDGQVSAMATPAAARAAGVSVVHQEFSLVPTLTVLENLFLGTEIRARFGRVDWRAQRRAATEAAARMGVPLALDRRVETLSIAEQQRVEIARSLLFDAKIIVLDEPSAVLAGRELEQLFEIVRGLRDSGTGVVYISHRLSELTSLADRVTVLRDGKRVETRPMEGTTEADLIRLMVGRDIDAARHDRQHHGDVVLEVSGVRLFKGGPEIDLTVAAGEVVGIAGLVGSGRTRLANSLAGIHRPHAGEVRLCGRAVRLGSPRASVAAGMAVIPENRRDEGALLPHTISENVALPNLREVSRGGLVRRESERKLAEQVIARLDVRPKDTEARVGGLSGGNQQKVVIGKSLVRSPVPQLFVFDEPTRGIDVPAKHEVHRAIADLAAAGSAVILISSELPEVLQCSHRILVMREGAIAGELPMGASEEDVMSLAVGTPA
ncbi:sugar ABC transporter ATP-binding protein [Nocardioides sp.]|uniref:sugar ABC transporter ATP-binding protein n=1 Tax=Nocardioides sp. TaxID=35761 RepID=UPI0025D19306|nr:sugar ABC transporter ATP-binding protein [Nocardioides sp.]